MVASNFVSQPCHNPSERRAQILQQVRRKWLLHGRVHQERRKMPPAKACLQKKAFQRKARQKAILQQQQRKTTGIAITSTSKAKAHSSLMTTSRVLLHASPLVQIDPQLQKNPPGHSIVVYDSNIQRATAYLRVGYGQTNNFAGQSSTGTQQTVRKSDGISGEGILCSEPSSFRDNDSCEMSVCSLESEASASSPIFNIFSPTTRNPSFQ